MWPPVLSLRGSAKDLLNQLEFGHDWKGLQQAVTYWFQPLEQGSRELLHFVGLCPE